MRFASAVVDGKSTLVASTSDCATCVDIGATLGVTSLRHALAAGLVDQLARGRVELPPAQLDVDTIRFLPLVPDPSRILCVGFNYRAHADETDHDLPAHPTFFSRFPSAHVGHLRPIEVPVASEFLDWEGEIAVVLGRGGRHIASSSASDHVAGYTCFADNSVRDFQMHGTQATAGKNFDRSGSFGPWLVTADEVTDPTTLQVITRVNGEEKQRGQLADLVFGIPELITYVSTFTTLEPGDVIATGTPSGIGARRQPAEWLRPGDVIEVEIPGLLTLRNPVAEEGT